MHHLRMPLVAPFETSFGREVDRECILIVAFSEGLVGLGECVASREPGYSYETIGTAWHILRDFLENYGHRLVAAGRAAEMQRIG